MPAHTCANPVSAACTGVDEKPYGRLNASTPSSPDPELPQHAMLVSGVTTHTCDAVHEMDVARSGCPFLVSIKTGVDDDSS